MNNYSESNNLNENIFIILLILSMLIWGGSWTSAKLIAGLINPLVLSFLRFFISFLSFIPIIIFFKEKLIVDRKTLLLIIISSLLLVLYNILFFFGLKAGLAGAGGVLVTSINPIFIFILSLIIHKKSISFMEFTGLILGVIGGLILLEIWNIGSEKIINSSNLIFIFASFIWAILAIIGKEIQKNISVFIFSFYMYGICSTINFFIALPFGITEILKMDIYFWLNIFYLSFISTVFATTIYFFCTKKLSVNKTGSFILLVPLFAVLSSFIILNEIPKITTVAGGLLAMTAIYLINKKSKQN